MPRLKQQHNSFRSAVLEQPGHSEEMAPEELPPAWFHCKGGGRRSQAPGTSQGWDLARQEQRGRGAPHSHGSLGNSNYKDRLRSPGSDKRRGAWAGWERAQNRQGPQAGGVSGRTENCCEPWVSELKRWVPGSEWGAPELNHKVWEEDHGSRRLRLGVDNINGEARS